MAPPTVMNEDQIPAPTPETADSAEAPKPAARRKTPARSPRKKAASAPVDAAADETGAAVPAKPKRAPRKPKAKAAETAPVPPTADLFAVLAPAAPPPAEPAPETHADGEFLPTAPVEASVTTDDGAGTLAVAEEAAPATVDAPPPAEAPEQPADETSVTAAAAVPAGPRRKRKRRRGKGERGADEGADEAGEQLELGSAPDTAVSEPPFAATPEAVEAPIAPVELAPAAEPAPLPPLTVVSLGLDQPPTLSAQALAALREARVVLGTADALDRLAGFQLDTPQELCAADSAHLDVRRVGHAGSVLVVVGDATGDGPAPELLAELGPAQVRVLPGVGRVQAACAALGLSAEIVSVVDLRRAPLAALRGQLRAHRLLAVPVADTGVPGAVARLLIDSGFSGARVWVCEFNSGHLQSKAWLATELAELRDPLDPHAVLIVATGPSAGVFAELPGLSDAALGEEAGAALPVSVRALALAWLQPAAWETGWAIADGEASLALEWARAVPTARVRAVGVEPSLLGMSMARAGVGENLAAVASATPQRCREWPVPEAVFVRGGVGLSDWLAAAWARLAPGGRLVATAEDDNARADLLAFAAEVPAEAWQELSLSRGETVAGRLRFAPAAPVRLALWRKPPAAC